MRSLKFGSPAKIAMALLFSLPLSTAALAESGTPFALLAGSWHGGGAIRYNDGSNERLSCNAKYSSKSGGSELALVIRCQSASNKIDMKSDLSYEGGRLSGHWSEKNFGLEGDLAGNSGASKFSMQISGQLQGTMSVSVSGATHNVNISTNGPGFKSVSIAFSKG
jgi:hypothetical protein